MYNSSTSQNFVVFISTSEHHKRKEVYSIRTGFVAKHLEDFPLRKLENCQRYLSVNQKIVVLLFKQKDIRMTSKNTLHCPKKYLRIKTEPVTAGADSTVYICLAFVYTYSTQKPDIYRYTLLLPTMIRHRNQTYAVTLSCSRLWFGTETRHISLHSPAPDYDWLDFMCRFR